MELVGPDEVHLPDEHRAVAEEAEPVGEGRNRRRQLAGVVERARRRRQQPRHQRGPGRHAERRSAVRALEDDPLGAEPLQVRRLHDPVAVGGQRGRRDLVGENEDKVGLVHIVHCVRLLCTG